MSRADAPVPPVDAARPWAGRAALAFVLLTLAALVAVPVLVQRRVDALRTEIETSEPARTVLTRLQFNLVREMYALSELLLGGDTLYSASYARARAAERATFAELEPLARALGPEVAAELGRVRAMAEQWHGRIAEDEIVAAEGTGAPAGVLPREQPLFEQLLGATAAMDSTILRATARNREQIQEVERLGIVLTSLLGLLALLAAGAVAALNLRVQRLAGESERRRREAEAALAETALANRARIRLLRGVTHDVKNPLGAAKGYAQLLAMGIKAPLHPDQAPLVAGVQRSVDAALAIIADLLDVARADSGGLSVERVETDLGRVAAEAVEDHRAEAETAGHELRLLPPAAPLTVHTDPTRVRQVLENLLSNAVKYTPPPGRIAVRTEVAERGPGPRAGTWAAVRVTDSGPGVPREMREAIFDEFTRLDDASPARGHGLGLAISRRIARLLDGELTVEEGEGPGATFVLWLPLRRVDAA